MKFTQLAFLVFIAACENTAQDPVPAPQPDTPTTASCPIHSPKDVQMWINAMPGPGATPTLIVNFKVTAATPGYNFDLKVLEVSESIPPQYVFDLAVTPPQGVVMQVETETDVRIEIANFDYAEIASATVKCGDSTLFTVDVVETAY